MSQHVLYPSRTRSGARSPAEIVGERRRSTAVLATLASVGALLAGGVLGPIGAANAAEPGRAHRLPPEFFSTSLSAEQMGLMPVESRITALRTLEDEAISQFDFQQVQGLEIEIAPLQSQVTSSSTTPPVSSDGAFSNGRDTAFEGSSPHAAGRG